MRKIINFIKLVAMATFFFVALGYCGNMDAEYEQQREVLLTVQPQRR